MEANADLPGRIKALLQSAGAPFRALEHEPTLTSADSAKARGEPLGCGAKALLLKTDDTFRLFVLPADRQLDSAGLKRQLGLKRLRFATPDELHELTGLVPGSVPPFGEPILPFPLYADESVGRHFPQLAFNCASLRHSIIMQAADWERIAQPSRGVFAAPLAGSA